MAPSRKPSNGRSPLVNPQRQITSFFSKATKQNPNSNASPSPSPSPTTPSPVQSKPNKPLLVIGNNISSSSPSPSPSPLLSTPGEKRYYGKEVVERRVRVYWPLDKAWYEGIVKCYDEKSNKHLVQYDDFEEELLDLETEKIEWIEEESVKRFKRLRRGSLPLKRIVIDDDDDDDDEEEIKEVDEPENVGDCDDSDDEDWEKNMEKEAVDEDEEDGNVGLVDEEEEKRSVKKRKATGGGSAGKKKKTNDKSVEEVNNKKNKVSVVEPVKKSEESNGVSNGIDGVVFGDAPEKFRLREAEKLWFLGVDRKDAKKRRSGDADYDPKTLYLPPNFVKSLSGGQRQWWEFKSKHMDKVLFFKMGKFYELFEMDAHIGAKELDLQYMKGEQPHCGFPERNFSMNVEKLARKGYRVLVVEQTETPEQLELRRKEKGSKDKVVKREICAVVTKGTLTEGEMLSANPDASYLMAVTENVRSSTDKDLKRTFGVCLVDVATSRLILGQFVDDEECSSLCCLLTELRPVEIIKPAKLLSFETERALMRHTRNPLVNELVPLTEFWDAQKTFSEVKAIYRHISDQPTSGTLNETNMVKSNSDVAENETAYLPDVLSDLANKGEDGSLALSALGGTLYYLKQAFLDETLLRFAKFELLPRSDFKGVGEKPSMILDSAALENLEIFENNRNGDSSGTLYSQLNHCVTAPGKRLLKTWLARPLYHSQFIKERQDAVAGLWGVNQSTALEFRKTISRLPDMERLLARIFSASGANGRNANKVVLYEDAAKKQLQEFISALRGCELMAQACSSLGSVLENVDSSLLYHFLTPGKGLPDVNSGIRHFKDAFDWVEANNTGRIIPHEGADLEYDSACKRVKEIESSLTRHLKEQRKLLGNSSIVYVTVGKESYLLEVPEDLRGRVPRDYELRSSKKGFYRYWTPDIKKLLGDLSQAESEKESTLKSILQRLIANFCEYHDKWRQLVSATAELDALISLAIASDFYEGPTCRPIIRDSLSKSDSEPCFAAKRMGHPLIRSDSLGKGSFVPNDIGIGGSGHANFILLTGPNMGGKSTLIRQVCLAVILAQVGANVPAESLELSPVDRIFVRMGAKDHIMAGQSTFLMELSETALMLSSATRNSLVALDELGRGTSTSDGQAIAEAVLEHFVQKVQCRGLFSTHYHRLAVDYQKNPKVSLFHMACHVGSSDGGVEEVTFLYRLSPGSCPKSYGVNVARLAGLPESILQKAAAISKDFEAKYGKHSKWTLAEAGVCSREKVELIQDLIDVSRNPTSFCSSGITGTRSLMELKYRVKMLLEQH